jgi:predicted nucleic acid-binding protein
MAQPALVLDASVAVKWFLTGESSGVPQALDILNGLVLRQLLVLPPDLICYEVLNALTCKKSLSAEQLKIAADSLYSVGMQIIPFGRALMLESVRLASQNNITVYDACYAALAVQNHCALITANPRHQNHGLNCQVIPLEKWH